MSHAADPTSFPGHRESASRLRARAWLERNGEAIAEDDARIERDGVFSWRYRTFMRLRSPPEEEPS